jgi:hypothetical protein
MFLGGEAPVSITGSLVDAKNDTILGLTDSPVFVFSKTYKLLVWLVLVMSGFFFP